MFVTVNGARLVFAMKGAKGVPDGPAMRAAGCGHGVHAEEPDRALGLIRNFVAAP